MLKVGVRRVLKRYYNRFISLKGEPEVIALGFAVGVAIGFFPILGTHTALTMLIAPAFRMHLAGMFLGSWISANPLTVPPMLAAEFWLGRWLLGRPDLVFPPGERTLQWALHLGLDILSCMFVGFVILGTTFSLASYPIVKSLITRVQTGKATVNP